MVLQVFTQVFGRLYAKFGLEPQEGARPPGLFTTIIPTTNIDTLLDFCRVDNNDLTLSGTSNQAILTVPQDERWIVHALDFVRLTEDRDINNIGLAAQPNAETLTFVRSIGAGLYSTGLQDLAMPLEPGWSIMVNFSGGTTDGTWRGIALSTIIKQQYRG